MGLSCSCPDDDSDYWYFPPQDFEKLRTTRRKRCVSCHSLIDVGADCAELKIFRTPITDIEERIYGNDVPMADRYLCEKCAEIYFNLDAAGFCYWFGDDLRENLRDYHEMTGFVGA